MGSYSHLGTCFLASPGPKVALSAINEFLKLSRGMDHEAMNSREKKSTDNLSNETEP